MKKNFSAQKIILWAVIMGGLLFQSCNSSNPKNDKKVTTAEDIKNSAVVPSTTDASKNQSSAKTPTTVVAHSVTASANQHTVAIADKHSSDKEESVKDRDDDDDRDGDRIQESGKPRRIEKEDDDDKYDGILAAQKQEFQMTKDPATNTVPKFRLIPMLSRRNVLIKEGQQRIASLKAAQAAKGIITPAGTTTTIDAASWVERGSYQDAPGPYGNGRDGNPVPSTSGRIVAFLADMDTINYPNQVFVGGIDGGLWTCPDITQSPAAWQGVGVDGDYASNYSNFAISSIAQDPSNYNTMYFGTGEKTINSDAVQGGGVWKSTDHGKTWSLLPATTSFYNVSKVVVDKRGYIYVGTIFFSTTGGGLWRSTDGGNTWTKITPTVVGANTFTIGNVSDMVYDTATDRLHVYMGYIQGYYRSAGYTSAAGYVYASRPDTVSSLGWQAATSGANSGSGTTANAGMTISTTAGTNFYEEMVSLSVRGKYVWALRGVGNTGMSTNSQILYESTDTGKTWKARTASLASGSTSAYDNGQLWYSIGMDAASNGRTAWFGGLNSFRVDTTATTATPVQLSEWVANYGYTGYPAAGQTAQYVHADVHNVYAGRNGRVIICSDGGIFYSADSGRTWADRNVGLRLKQFYSCAINPSVPDYFIAGAQDNGCHQFTQPGLGTSVEINGGDGFITSIDQNNPQNQFGSYAYCTYHVSTDGGNNWKDFTFGSSAGQFSNPFDYDNNAKKLYSAYTAGTYLRFDDPTTTQSTYASVSVSSTPIGSNILTAVTVSPNLANTIYIAGNSQVVKVVNANTSSPTFTTITPPVTSGSYISSIIIGPSTTDQDIIVTSSSYGSKKVFISANGGSSWTEITGNLPDMPVRWAFFYPGTNTQAYIATEAGVWYTTAINGASTNWAPSVGFPSVRTDMIKYSPTLGIMAVATHGRGLWTTQISTTPNISFYFSQLNVSKSSGTTTTGCRTYQDYYDTLIISNPPTGDATVTIAPQSGNTAIQGVDFDITTNGDFTNPSNTVTFASGVYPNRVPVTIRVYNNHDKNTASIQPQTAVLALNISGSTDAVASPSNQTVSISLTDVFPPTTTQTNQTIWTENWETGGSSAWTFFPASNTPNGNIFVDEPSVGCGTPIAGSYSVQLFGNDPTGALYYCYNGNAGAYTARFYRPVTGGTNHYTNMAVTFSYKSNQTTSGTITNSLVYSTDNGNTWTIIASYASSTTTKTVTGLALPAALNNTNFLLGWQSVGTSGAVATSPGVMFDNITLTGTINVAPIDSTQGSNATNYLATGENIDFLSANNNIFANITNASQLLECTTANIDSAGAIWQSYSNGLRSQKVISITPTTNGSSASYTVNLYYTNTELGGTDPSQVKIAKTDASSIATADGTNTILAPTTYAAYGSGYVFTAPFTNGFSKFFLVNNGVCLTTYNTLYDTACGTYTFNGTTYNASGTYYDTLTNVAGCDSIVTLNLVIKQPTTGTDVESACGSYTWIDGNTYTASNNTATYTLQNAAGCDSIVTLNLTIKQPTTGTDVESACGSYTWIDGNTYTASNNTATYTLQNAAGCDSIVTLNLTIKQPTTYTDVETACGSYTWIDGNTYTASNNTATYTLQNAAGCDSVVTLNLTINQPTTGTDVETACDSYTWIDGNTYTASNNTATYTLQNAAGCDSVVTLNLTITHSVTLGSFTALANSNGTTLLQWTTLAEQNNQGFDIQRSTDNITWSDIGFVNSQAPSGNSSAGLSYTYTDGNPVTGTDYYRLKTTDCNGSTVYSDTVSATFGTLSFTLSPNPARDRATVSGLAGNEEIRIIDAAGRTLSTLKATGHSTEFSLSGVASGTYFVQIKTAGGMVTLKGIKKE